ADAFRQRIAAKLNRPRTVPAADPDDVRTTVKTGRPSPAEPEDNMPTAVMVGMVQPRPQPRDPTNETMRLPPPFTPDDRAIGMPVPLQQLPFDPGHLPGAQAPQPAGGEASNPFAPMTVVRGADPFGEDRRRRVLWITAVATLTVVLVLLVGITLLR